MISIRRKQGAYKMEWLVSIQKTIQYVEAHLLEDISAEELAEQVAMSSFYLQRGFKLMTGYSVGEYIRNRRLYMAALDVITQQDKIIEIAYRYGYETPESFTKAFVRFHGLSPNQLRQDRKKITVFLPLKIAIQIQGGNEMDFIVEKMKRFSVIGFERVFSMDTSYMEIPKFWDEVYGQKIAPLCQKEKPENSVEEAVIKHKIGEFGVCIDDIGKNNEFRYLIAGTYTGGEVPEGMTLYEVPDMEWAKFSCKGPMPGALQAVNTKIFQEWLPGNPDYEIALGTNVEWYSAEGNTTDADYESAIWIPVKRKEK